jgi:hypothetical protein
MRKILTAYFIGLALFWAIISLVGCSGSMVCRHTAMAHYSWATEERLDNPKIVIFTTTAATRILALGIWNAHVQATVQGKDGKRLWISGDIAPYLSGEPEYPLGKFAWEMDLLQYVEWLSRYRELSKLPYIENPLWPKSGNLK